VPPRLSAAERIRAQIDELFASEQDLGQVLEQVARLSVRLVVQAALEAAVSEFLGRDRYARGDRDRAGYRNGHAELTVKTTAGPVVLERPKLRGTTQPFTSRLLGKGVSRTNALEALVISGFVRGLSTRDVEAALGEALGPEAALSKSTVSRICQAIKDEFDAWKARDLQGIELEYLFLDGSHFRMHPGASAEPVLCAWGITSQGAPVLVGLAPGSDEGHDPWAGFLGELVARGLRSAAGDHRRRARTHRRGRGRLRQQPAAAVSCPPSQKPARQGPKARPGRGQGRVLADLRRHHRRPWRAGGH